MVRKNAYKYGFILRYTDGKEHIKGITLEEYIKNKSYYSVRREAN